MGANESMEENGQISFPSQQEHIPPNGPAGSTSPTPAAQTQGSSSPLEEEREERQSRPRRSPARSRESPVCRSVVVVVTGSVHHGFRTRGRLSLAADVGTLGLGDSLLSLRRGQPRIGPHDGAS
ncbi:unnamed protein product [Arctogadus glacialis]